MTIPDSPDNVINISSVTSSNTIGIAWTAGLNDGGSVIIDYQVFYTE